MAHKHKWQEKVMNHAFRYCKICGQLERNMGIGFQIYPRIRLNPNTGEMLESSGYHRIITEIFDPNHVIPEYPDFGNRCWMCGKESDYLAVRQNDWPELYVNLCGPCHHFQNPEWKKGICIGDDHKWHPVCTNPKRCYRCGYTSDLDDPKKVEELIRSIIEDARTLEDPDAMMRDLANTLRRLLKWKKVTPQDIKMYTNKLRIFFTMNMGYSDEDFSRLLKWSFALQEKTIEVEL